MDSYERLRSDCIPPNDHARELPPLARRWFHVAMGEWVHGDSHGLWLEPEARDGHSDPHELAYRLGERLSTLYNVYNSPATESPIEEMMIGPLLWIPCEWAGFPGCEWIGGPDKHLESYGPGSEKEVLAFLSPQAEMAGYRVDFLLWFLCGRHTAGVVIECDGHNYHDKTKEQAARDKARDRALLTAGYPVMRFTGSEIFADPIKCAEQVRAALIEPLNRVSRLGGILK